MYILISSLAALLTSIIVLLFANSLIAPTIVLNANSAGTPLGMIGLIPAIYGVGFVIGCFLSRSLIRSIGHIRSFAFAGAILTSVAVLMLASNNVFILMLLRGFMGIAVAIVITCIESWISAVTSKNSRGRVLGFYSTVSKLAYVGAPALLSYSMFISHNAIIFAVLLYSLSLIPICLTKLSQPKIGPKVSTSYKVLFKDIPSAFVAVFIIGFTNVAILDLLPIYGLKQNFTQSNSLALLSAAHLGGLIFQWPIGYVSDFFGRRIVLIAVFAISATSAVTMIFLKPETLMYALFVSFLWGGMALSTYSVALSHAIDRITSEETVNTCATILMIWSIGAIFGPVFGSFAMQVAGANALYLFCGVFHALAALFILIRVMTSAKRKQQITEHTQIPAVDALWPKNRPLV